MPQNSSYKQFVAQFTLPEWKRLCKHRLFLHFLKLDLKIAASIAADALQRPIRYTFSREASSLKGLKKKPSSPRSSKSKFNHRRFRF